MLERLDEPKVTRFKVADGVVFVEYSEPDGETIGHLEADIFPSPVLVVRDPQRAHYSFRSDWFLPTSVEPPARWTTFGKCMDAASYFLDPKKLEGFKIKKRPASKPTPEEKPKMLRGQLYTDRNGITVDEQMWSDGSMLWVFTAPHLFDGELHLSQPTRKHTIFHITKRPKGMVIGDHWSSAKRLHDFLGGSKKHRLF